MNAFDAVLLGVIEGFTEFLPISSTGHLILTAHLLGLAQTDFVKTFEIAIQLGSILAVVVLHLKQFFKLSVLLRLVLGFIPTGVIGFFAYPYIKSFLIGSPMIVVGALILGGLALIVIERYTSKAMTGRENTDSGDANVSSLSLRHSFLLGVFQSVAMIPGVSRSGACIAGGLLLKIPRTTLLSFTFLLAVPTMLVATSYDLYKNPEVLTAGNFEILAIGFVTAFIVALATIKTALSFVKKWGFAPFGYYRIALGLLFIIFIL